MAYEETKFTEGIIITSFGLVLIAKKAMCKADVPLLQLIAYLALVYFLILFSNFRTDFPVVIRFSLSEF
jgi:uncharacterized membrane protein